MASNAQDSLRILSWNVRGLNSKYKRSLLFQYLKHHNPHVVLLQETHLMGSKTLALKRPWVQKMFHATYSSYSRGVSILIAKSLPCQVETVVTDPNGKYVLLVLSILNQRYVIVNVYLPPPGQVQLMYTLLEKFTLYCPAKILIMGDFNATLSPVLDRPNPPHKFSPDLVSWAQAANLTEAWRWLHPQDREYSCFSTTFKTSSRIDLAFANLALLGELREAKYLPSGLSDHSPLELTLTIPRGYNRALWRLQPRWIAHATSQERIPPGLREFWELNAGSASPDVTWDAFKANGRGQYISTIAAIKAEHGLLTSSLQSMVDHAAAHYVSSPTGENFDHLASARRQLHLHMSEATTLGLQARRQEFFEFGDKSSKLLAILAQDERPVTVIPKITTSAGVTVTSQEDILAAFTGYYTTLYTSSLPPAFEPTSMNPLLDGLALGWLSDSERRLLVAEFTPDEILRAIHSFPAGKAPGPDGIPIEFYRAHADLLVPRLAELYKSCLSSGSLAPSMREAHIILLPKPNKDPSICASYRPIALLNCDLKILTKILAVRLNKVIKSLVDSDQTGFMPGRSTDVNIRRLFSNIHAPHENQGTRTIATLDMEKAFDTVEWAYLWEVMRRMGFPLRFIDWIRTLYAGPLACIRLGGLVSAPIHLQRGTRQGCPLSPTLFALAMEPIAEALRTSPNIRGLRVGWLEERVALYADDLLLFLNDAGASLQGALQIMSDFSEFTGLRVNWHKSLLFPVDEGARVAFGASTPLQWVDRFVYLGVVVSRRSEDFGKDNLDPILAGFGSRLKAWSNLPLSLLGRINLIKMKLLPKLIYIFRNSPLWLPRTYFDSLKRLFLSFLWGSKPPRYKYSTLTRPKDRGGLAMPDCFKYFLASQLVTAHWWLQPDLTNSAVVLEAAIVGSLEALRVLLFRGSKSPHPLTPSMCTTLRAWRAGEALQPRSPTDLSPCTPLWLNPTLPHFFTVPDPQAWARYKVTKLEHIVSNSELISFPDLCSKYNIPVQYYFRYLQVSHAFRCQFLGQPLSLSYSDLESTLRVSGLVKPTSQIYAHLSVAASPELSSLRQKWVRDIPGLDEDDWREVWDYPFAPLISARDKMIHFKFLHRAYFTPHRLHIMAPSHSPKCWRCSHQPGDFFHVFWSCPKIVQFWGEVLEVVKNVTQIIIPWDPRCCLLGLVEQIEGRVAKRTLISLLLFYARKAIAMCWKKTSPPTVQFWLRLINNSLPLYKLTFTNRGCVHKFQRIWSCWIEDVSTAVERSEPEGSA